jgi:hypothetical protein
MQAFDVVHHDGAIQVRIEDDGYCTMVVHNINDQEIVIRAINKAFRLGALRGVMFTGDCANEKIARMHLMRAENGTTYLGGKVTYIADGENGPQFRIEWEVFPSITE